jgi:flagellar hook-associated protein 1 FlgK
MTNVYSIALGAMNAERRGVGLISHNIANSGVEGYTRVSLDTTTSVIDGTVSGVDVRGVIANVDEVLQDRLYDKISKDTYDSEIKSYLEKMHGEFGSPAANNSIDAVITKMQIALKNLSESSTSSSHKLIAVQEIDAMANKISTIAKKFQELRYEADKEIGKSVTVLNGYLSDAYKVSNVAGVYPKGTVERATAEDKLRNSLEKISEFLEISKYTDSAGACKVLTAQGVSIVGESQNLLYYTPLNSVTNVINDGEFSSITVSYIDSAGNNKGMNTEIVSGGKSSDVTSTISSGKLAALVYLRDKEIPKALEQLDTLAKGIKEEYNRIHNEGVSSFAPSRLDGTTMVSRDQIFGFQGKTRMVLVDNLGKQHDNIPALTLDFSKLDTGDGAGNANLHGILQEINYHFGNKLSVDKSIQLGDLTDIKLAAISKDMTAGGILDLDMELQNLSSNTSNVRIISAAATDGLGANILNSFVNTAFNVAPRETARTGTAGPSLQLNLPSTINYPLTITLDVRANDGVTDKNSQISFIINAPTVDTFNGIKNQRFSASTANGDGTALAPNFLSPLLTTSLAKSDGSPASYTSTDKGTLKLASFSNDYHIVIDSLDSSQNGYSAQNIFGTKEKFSYYFGLNDLFVRKDSAENWGNTKNTALYLDVRKDIKTDANKLSSAKIARVVDQANPATILSTFEISSGDTQNLQELINLSQKKIFFAQSGTLSATTVSMQEYAAEILGFNTTSLSQQITSADQSALMRNSIKEKIQDLKGVNVNEELANMLIHQQNITANSRVFSVAREIEQIMLNIIN